MDLLNKIDNFFHMNQRSIMLNSNGSLKPNTLNMFVDIVGIAINRDVITHEFALNRRAQILGDFVCISFPTRGLSCCATAARERLSLVTINWKRHTLFHDGDGKRVNFNTHPQSPRRRVYLNDNDHHARATNEYVIREHTPIRLSLNKILMKLAYEYMLYLWIHNFL